MYHTLWGSIIEWDSDDKDDLTIWHPEEQLFVDVFVSATFRNFYWQPGECYTIEIQNPIPHTVSKFDSEIADPFAYNLLSIGLPCDNSVSAALMDNPAECHAGIGDGEGLVRLLYNNNKYQMVAFGGTDEDTRQVSLILRDYEDYTLSGTEMIFDLGIAELVFRIDSLSPVNGSSLSSSTREAEISFSTTHNATCMYSNDPDIDFNSGTEFSTTGGSLHEDSFDVRTGTTYNFYYICMDNEGEIINVHHNFEVKSAKSSSGKKSSSPSDAPVRRTQTTTGIRRVFLNLEAGDIIDIIIENAEISVSRIIITLKQDIDGTSRMHVTGLSSRQRLVTPPKGKVYQYLEITDTNFFSYVIEEAVIHFNVNKSWMSENNVSPDDIVLFRFEGDIWVRLESIKQKEDAVKVYFKAFTPGFSYFAVGAEEKQTMDEPIDVVTVIDDTPVNRTADQSLQDSEDTLVDTEQDKFEIPWTYLYIALIIVVCMGAGYYIYTNRESISDLFISDKGKGLNQQAGMQKMKLSKNESNIKPEYYDKQSSIFSGVETEASKSKKSNVQTVSRAILDEVIIYGMELEDIRQKLNTIYTGQDIDQGFAAINMLRDYVKNEKAKGYNLLTIKKALVSKGWNSALMDKLIEFMGRQKG